MPETQYQSTTQIYLDVYDITNDLLIMKDGTASMVITVDAMNFGLLAEEEQDAVMYAYAGLLNSLNYPIQIVIRSQTKDVTSYLQKLKEQEDLASTRERQDRIKRYREFVSNLIRERNVLDKKFYVVVSATSIELGLLPPSTVLPGSKAFDISTIEKSVILEKARTVLEPKRDHIIGQFARIGLYSKQLTTQEIIQLFYLSYNPEAAEGQQLTDSRSYTTPLVSASLDASVLQNFNSATVQTQQTTQDTSDLLLQPITTSSAPVEVPVSVQNDQQTIPEQTVNDPMPYTAAPITTNVMATPQSLETTPEETIQWQQPAEAAISDTLTQQTLTPEAAESVSNPFVQSNTPTPTPTLTPIPSPVTPAYPPSFATLPKPAVQTVFTQAEIKPGATSLNDTSTAQSKPPETIELPPADILAQNVQANKTQSVPPSLSPTNTNTTDSGTLPKPPSVSSSVPNPAIDITNMPANSMMPPQDMPKPTATTSGESSNQEDLSLKIPPVETQQATTVASNVSPPPVSTNTTTSQTNIDPQPAIDQLLQTPTPDPVQEDVLPPLPEIT